jgi:hypothetical protein
MTITNQETEPLLNEKELAKWVRRSVFSIRRDRILRLGPPFLKFGKTVRYDPRAVREYIAGCERRPSVDA